MDKYLPSFVTSQKQVTGELRLKSNQEKFIRKVAEGCYFKTDGYKEFLEDLSKWSEEYSSNQEEMWKKYETVFQGYGTWIKWTKVTRAFTPWRENRKNIITTLEEQLKATEKEENDQSYGKMTQDTVDLISKGLRFTALAAGPLTSGTSGHLTKIADVAQAGSKYAGLSVEKERIKSLSTRARELLEEDTGMYKLLEMVMHEVDEVPTWLSCSISKDDVTGKPDGGFVTAATDVLGNAAGYTQYMGPVSDVLGIADTVEEGKKLLEGEQIETSKELNENIDKLDGRLKSACDWFETHVPSKDVLDKYFPHIIM